MIVFLNGKIYTVNYKQAIAEAVLVEGNKILFAGTTEEVRSSINKRTEIIDLKGKLMLPGFIDSHLHFMNGGFYVLGVDLHKAKSISEFINILKQYLENNKGKWITGGNWDHEQWAERILPDKEIIDPFTIDTPVLLERIDKHIALANSLALKLADINTNTPDPPGGEIVRNEKNEATGILKDNAINLVYNIIPDHTDYENYKAAESALQEAKKNGITSIHDISYLNDLPVYLELEKNNRLTCRINSILPIGSYKELRDDISRKLSGSSKIKFNSIKAFADGSLGAGTAWFFDPYENSTYKGLPQENLLNGRFEEWFLEADKSKIQIATHAIGDKAIYSVLEIYKKIMKENPYWDRRLRIEHAQHLRLEDISVFKELNVIASCQPHHLFYDGSWAEKKIGTERIKYAYPLKSILDQNVKMCFGSDWPVVTMNPLLGIWSAVTRETNSNRNSGGWIPEQKISVEEAVKCYTLNAAYASYEENEKGSMEAGKLADFTVLSEDIFKIPPEEIKDVKVDMTVFDGEIIYSR